MAGIWIFTDTHLGARSNSLEWLEIMEKAHFDFIIPTIKENWKEGDSIMNCGDVYDNRTSVNLKALDLGIKVYEELGKLGVVNIIAGNHDIYFKNSTEITSLDVFKYLPNVHVHKEPTIIELGGQKIFLMPWRKSILDESNTLKQYQKDHKCDYAFMHGTFSLMKYNKYVDIQEADGVFPKSASGYKRVYSGHIHWGQQKGNINIIGTPYEITRGDSGNKKGIYYLDLETGKETFYENTISPKFLSYTINTITKDIILEINENSKNNFVDIHIQNKLLVDNSTKLSKVFNKISETSRAMNIFPIDNQYDNIDETSTSLDAKELINKEIDNRFEDLKDRKLAHTIVNDIIKHF